MNNVLDIALGEYGVTEVVGKKHNPRILTYFKAIGHRWVTTDETAWCSAFANFVALKAGYALSGKLNARSWLKVGTKVKIPQQGDVVIFWREKRNSWKGHVGFFIGYSEDKKYIYVLGGNQNNQVNIKPYPTYRLLGFRSIKKTFRPLFDAA
ncbi:TIGR02594 family protein [Aquimarina algiphila]|uniref:TIGR02594 family protein n=1 Tax=Aquimarina algiphila TaxID=2047982 RepID=A0A554VJ59_9FLAO|nr:TIGR02594 family protein [Aquimarina algiphila]TSE07915.1 TIGR02594 family protein [Aquimarina algiphila]